MPLRQAKLRLTHIPIKPNHELAYYAAVRTVGRAAARSDWPGLVHARQTGRRATGRDRRGAGLRGRGCAARCGRDRPPAADGPKRALGVLGRRAGHRAFRRTDRDRAAAGRARDPPRRRQPPVCPCDARRGAPVRSTAGASADDARGGHQPRLRPRGGRRGVGQVRRRRLDGGPYVLARPDGSEVEVRFSAKANAPWPGLHASLLVPTDAATNARERGRREDSTSTKRSPRLAWSRGTRRADRGAPGLPAPPREAAATGR